MAGLQVNGLSVPVLNKENYPQWRKIVEGLIAKVGSYDLINKEYKEGESPDYGKESTGITQILLTISLDDQLLVNGCKTIKETLSVLNKRYEKAIDEYTIIEAMNDLEWTRTMSAEQYVTKLNEIRRKKKTIDPNSKDFEFIQKLVRDMPSCLGHVKVNYDFMMHDSTKKNDLKYETVCDQVISCYNRYMKERNNRIDSRRETNSGQQNRNQQNIAFVARTRGCWNCNDLNHKQNTCPYPPKKRFSRYDVVQQRMSDQRSDNFTSNQEHRQFNNQMNGYQSNNNQQRYQNGGHQQSNSYDNSANSVNQSYSNANYQNNNNQESINSQRQANRNQSSGQNDRSNRSSNENRTGDLNDRIRDFSLCTLCYSEDDDGMHFKLDDASTIHFTNDLNDFETYNEFDKEEDVFGISIGKAKGIGTVRVVSEIQGKEIEFTLQDVRYIPTAPCKVFSQIASENKGCRYEYEYTKTHNYQYGRINGEIVVTASRMRSSINLYTTTLKVIKKNFSFLTDNEWHAISGHRSYQGLDKTQNCVENMQIEKTSARNLTCNPCVLGKMKRKTFNHSLRNDEPVGHTLHSDINNMPYKSLKGKLYAIHIVDAASNYQRIGFLKHVSANEIKNELDNAIVNQIKEIGVTPMRVHCDRGRGYMAAEVRDYLFKEYGIQFTFSTAYNHEENGISEKAIQDITAMARTMMISKGVPNRMWAEALNTAVYINNRLFNNRIGKTPFEMYFGVKPDLSHMKEFGSDVMQYIPSQFRNKLQPRSKLMKFVGYTESSSIYRISNPDYSYVTEDKNLTFVKNDSERTVFVPEEDENREQKQDEDKDEDENSANDEENEKVSTSTCEDAKDAEELKAPVNVKSKLIPQHFEFAIHADSVAVPKTIEQVYENEYKDLWLEAMDNEYWALLGQETWELVPRDDNMIVLRGIWLFSLKTDNHNFVEKFKARYVIDGSDLNNKKYAPTLNLGNLRVLLSYAIRNKFHIHVMDVKNAYLNAEYKSDVYMHQVKHYEVPNLKDHVCRILKAQYGLPESAYLWNKLISSDLMSMGLNQSRVDACIFYAIDVALFITLHTDDIGIMSDNLNVIEQFKRKIKSKYEVVDKGEIGVYLGIEFTYLREEGRLYMNQHQKIKKLFEQVKDLCERPNKLPLPANTNMYKSSEPCVNIHLYQCMIGALNYLGQTTRPDIVIYVSKLAQFMRDPTVHHTSLALKLISYLNSTSKLSIKFNSSDEDLHVRCYTDAGSKFILKDNGRYTSGISVLVGGNIIHWSSKKQTIVSIDSCEAELFALNYGQRVSLQYRNLLDELQLISENEQVIELLCDNRSTLDISENGFKKHSRHYNVCLLYVKDFLDRNEIRLDKVHSAKNIADLFTKYPEYCNFDSFCKVIKLVALIPRIVSRKSI